MLNRLRNIKLNSAIEADSVHSRMLEDWFPVATPTSTGTQSIFTIPSTSVASAAAATPQYYDNLSIRTDGNFAYVNGSLGFSALNVLLTTWTSLFTFTTSGINHAAARAFKPSSAVLGPASEMTTNELVPHSAWICGHGLISTAANTSIAIPTTAAAPVIFRISCTAADTYSFDMMSTTAVNHAGTCVTGVIINASWPIEKITENMQRDILA
jgi:hypothetical protein